MEAKTSNQKKDHLKTLRSNFENLSDSEQIIVLLISMIHIHTSRTLLVKCLVKLDIKTPKGTRFKTNTISPVLDKLIDLELIDNANYPGGHDYFSDYALKLAADSDRLERVASVLENMENSGQRLTDKQSENLAKELRNIRLAYFRKKYDLLEKLFFKAIQKDNPTWGIQYRVDKFFENISQEPFSYEIPLKIKLFYLNKRLLNALTHLKPCETDFETLQKICKDSKSIDQESKTILALCYLFHAQFDEARKLLINSDGYSQLLINGWLACLTDKGDQAIEYYQNALNNINDQVNETIQMSIFFCFAELLRRDTSESFEKCKSIMRLARAMNLPDWFSKIFELFTQAISCRIEPDYKPSFHFPIYQFNYMIFQNKEIPPLALFFSSLGASWFNNGNFDYSLLFQKFKKAQSSGYLWFAGESAKILLHSNMIFSKKEKEELTSAVFNAKNKGLKVFIYETFNKQVNWQVVINKLLEIKPSKPASKPKSKKEKNASSRLAWFIDIRAGKCLLKPKEQTQNSKGNWSKGRPIALKRLKEDTISIPFLSSQDAKICSDISLDIDYSSRYFQKAYHLNYDNAITKLIDHPFVFMEDAPKTPVEIVIKAPELRISRSDNALNISIYPVTDGNQESFVEQESPTRVNLYQFDQNQKYIAKYLQQAVVVPSSEKKKIQQLIDKLSSLVTIHSDMSDFKGKTVEVPSDKTPHISLQHYGNGLKIVLRVRPFKKQGPYFKPGVGGNTVIATVKRKSIQTSRDLQGEQKLAKTLIDGCPTLAETNNGTWEWLLDDTIQALNLLLELKELNDKPVVEWPEGQPITISEPISIKSMKFSICKKTDWFETTGELFIDEKKIISFRNLLDLIETSPGKFIPLDNRRYLALTDQFRRQLEIFNSCAEKTRQRIKIHKLAALALGDFTDGADSVIADKQWQSHIERLKEGLNYQPEMPSTFQGELRNYQIEGVQWLMRLNFWQVGACLADDMGLGKTIQALALMLNCAHEGPILVVAPSSVTFNWLRETRRFAPTLKPKILTGKKRSQLMENLQPFDLLISSYTLLVMESERLKSISWRIVILDEAQAIKNAETKRSQAAMDLKGDFKMVITGTPIENHLGELWNLFRFINPGLLSSRKKFNERFANPIEQNVDLSKRFALKKLIQPFILRRLKSQVLDELPAKTEIVLEVIQSEEEMALYEAIRQKALEKLSKKSNNKKGQRYIQILAEIMRLRRACCHPRLVMPESQLSSSKLKLIGEVLDELLKNKHKALVFSQFVGHLSIVREYLDEQGISYKYLDGKTPAAVRHKHIDAFQAGEGNVFLISLKAGGTGLNLTAADYVLHLDPWWNPAVEDQATDRAHRIGQQRPVTVYRFVTQNTIEEKILALHHNKRNLAHDLLSGSDLSSKMTNDELLELIKM